MPPADLIQTAWLIVGIVLLLIVTIFCVTAFCILRKKYIGLWEIERVSGLKRDACLLAFSVALSIANVMILDTMQHKNQYLFYDGLPRLLNKTPGLFCVAVLLAVSIKLVQVALNYKASVFLNLLWIVYIGNFTYFRLLEWWKGIPFGLTIGFIIILVAIIISALILEFALDKLIKIIKSRPFKIKE